MTLDPQDFQEEIVWDDDYPFVEDDDDPYISESEFEDYPIDFEGD